MAEEANYLYLNRDGRWLDFHWAGLELTETGGLELESAPMLAGPPPPGLAALPAPDGPAGIAFDPHGSLFWTDPVNSAIWWRESCFGTTAPVPCIRGGSGLLGAVSAPRGLAYHRQRQLLMVADSGNHRIALFETQSFSAVGVWGQDYASSTEPGSEPGRLDTPWGLAAAEDGSVYVLDRGNRRVQKFDIDGRVDAAFWSAVLGGASHPRDPVEIAVSSGQVAVLDGQTSSLFLFDLAGTLLRTIALAVDGNRLGAPMGLAATAQSFYVGDNARWRLFRFAPGGRLVAAARNWNGPVAAVALEPGGTGGIWVHPGGLAPLRLELTGARAARGAMAGGPFKNLSGRSEQYHRIVASSLDLPPGAHLRLFTYMARDAAAPAWQFDSDDPFPAASGWSAVAQDAPETLIPGRPFDNVWLGVLFSSEGTATPALSQIRVDFDHPSLLRFLPPLYSTNDASRDFLNRFLALFEGEHESVQGRIAGVAALYDPFATPPQWLDWLAGWLALDISEDWSESRKGAAIAAAFRSYESRGTARGMSDTIRTETGLDAAIVEPLLATEIWSLADAAQADAAQACSILGFTTMLASTEPGGAVLGTTAALDGSNLLGDDEFGQPLFTATAHQFAVEVYRGASFSEMRLADLRTLLGREQPAHTVSAITVVEPRMRVGYQSRIGIDTVVAGPPAPAPVGDTAVVTQGFVLGGEVPARLDDSARVGQTMRIE